jgi:Protein of unknown function (DUF2514)
MISLPWLGLGAAVIYAAGVASGMLWSSDRAQAREDRAAVAQLQADLKAQQDQAARLQAAKDRTDEELQIARDAAARAAAASLRDTTSARKARAAAAPAECKADAQAAAVYSDLLRRADQRAGELAAIADDSRARGIGCERHYEAIAAPSP